MALRFSQIPLSSSTITSPKSRTVAKPTTFFSKHPLKFPQFASRPLKFSNIPKAAEKEEKTTTADENPGAESEEDKTRSDEMTELGMEIKKAMKERGEKEEPGFFSGVVEEIKEIEWPAFNKVLGTTGVVLGVMAASSVVLLTLNAVLAEISDQVFAGKGLQDFFG